MAVKKGVHNMISIILALMLFIPCLVIMPIIYAIWLIVITKR